MTILTIEKSVSLNQNTFSDVQQLFRYLVNEKIVSYTEIGTVVSKDMSATTRSLYDESKSLSKDQFIDVTTK